MLREALARDEYDRSRNSAQKIRKADAERKVKSFIQNIMHFRDANLGIPATEFDVQGLELDWVGVCWDADFRAVNGQWAHYKFTGTRWQNVNERYCKLYLTNAYRVLLTRARQGIVVYVPIGDTNDATRQPEFYDGTAEFLLRCGIEPIESAVKREADEDWIAPKAG